MYVYVGLYARACAHVRVCTSVCARMCVCVCAPHHAGLAQASRVNESILGSHVDSGFHGDTEGPNNVTVALANILIEYSPPSPCLPASLYLPRSNSLAIIFIIFLTFVLFMRLLFYDFN